VFLVIGKESNQRQKKMSYLLLPALFVGRKASQFLDQNKGNLSSHQTASKRGFERIGKILTFFLCPFPANKGHFSFLKHTY